MQNWANTPIAKIVLVVLIVVVVLLIINQTKSTWSGGAHVPSDPDGHNVGQGLVVHTFHQTLMATTSVRTRAIQRVACCPTGRMSRLKMGVMRASTTTCAR